MTNDTSDILALIDTETTGLLQPEADCDPLLLEVGCRIVDLDLDTIASFKSLVWDDGYSAKLQHMREYPTKSDEFVLDMHDKSGLWKEAAQHGSSIQDVQKYFCKWLNSVGLSNEVSIKDRSPMMGSSIQFDRDVLRLIMPDAVTYFSYRNIDISTVKELCRRFNPELYGKLNNHYAPQALHRVEPDLEDTLSEFKFYYDNFLFVGDIV